MTALDQYIRLEAVGRWRERSGEPWQEVLVSFGNSSLILSDFNEAALTHWALAAITISDQNSAQTLFAPDIESDETLEITDREMIDAIAKTTALARAARTPKPRRSRLKPFVYLSLLACVLAGIVYLPAMLRERAFKIIPPERAALIGSELAERLAGDQCKYQPGQDALAQIQRRVDVAEKPPLVLRAQRPLFARLPGGQLLLSSTLIETAQTPEALAGWLILANQREQEETVLYRLIEGKSALAATSFLFSGEIRDNDKIWMFNALPETETRPEPSEIETIRARLAQSGIAETPFLKDLLTRFPNFELLRPTGREEPGRDMMPDQSWVALQSICAGL